MPRAARCRQAIVGICRCLSVFWPPSPHPTGSGGGRPAGSPLAATSFRVMGRLKGTVELKVGKSGSGAANGGSASGNEPIKRR